MNRLIKINYLAFSIVLFSLGINIIIFNDKLYKGVVILLLLYMFMDAIKQIFTILLQKKKNKFSLTINIFTIIILIILLNNKDIPYSILPFILGCYILLNGIIKTILTIILFKNNVKGKIISLITTILFLSAGISLMFSPLMHLNSVLIIIGIYTILLGFNYLNDYFDTLSKKERHILKRQIRIPLPAILEMIVPYTFLKTVNKHLNNDNDTNEYELNKENCTPDMEIFIHVTDKGNGKLGHVDILFDDKIISYGNYDFNSYKLFDSIGDGVVFTTTKDKYLKFCIKNVKKTLFGYGLKLTDGQIEDVRREITKLKSNLYPWKPEFLKDKNVNCYTKRLYKMTKAKFYKFKSGRFKIFFLLGNNCARFADCIIGATGSDILKINGIITPGTYQEYLDTEFNKKNSMVISRTIYNKKNIK